jgi:hypothetical protein
MHLSTTSQSIPAGARPRGRLALASLLLAPSLACVATAPGEAEDAGPAVAREAWSDHDDPRLLGASFDHVLADLPSWGVAERLPWPGPYWPSHRDSINYRWAGPNSRSPAEKYGLAFGKSGVEDAVSHYYGVDSLPGASCRKKSDCDEGEACARRRGEKSGVCTETWVGLCHAWAPAALLEREPRKAVTYNGVRFEINDLKALVTILYDKGLSARFMSLRCDEQGDEHNITNLDQCEDTNPGSFHVAVANLLGIQRRAFIEDRVYDREVWNFPVIAYRVTRNTKISAASANELLGAEGSEYAFNHRAVELRRIRTELTWVNIAPEDLSAVLTDDIEWFAYTDSYNYILELDEHGEIIGGEWLGKSRTNHPDFLWLPEARKNVTVAGVIETGDVRKLLDLASGS